MSDLAPDPRSVPLVPMPSGVGPLAVLIVEDDPTAALLMTAWLAATGAYRVTVATSGAAAMQHLTWSDTWAVLICDLHLPDRSGFEIVAEARTMLPWLPVLVVTADPSRDAVVAAMRAQVDDICHKPITGDDLCARVAALAALGVTRAAAHRRTILAIGAHPDDVEIGIGGILLRHVARGDRVIHLCLTDGEEGGYTQDRIAEVERAADRMGVTLIRGHLRDTQLLAFGDTIRVITEAIREWRPDDVYVHTLADAHQDHRAAHQATLVAARTVPNLLCYQSPSSTADFKPQRFVDITAQLEAKLAVIHLYVSQVAIRPYLRDDLLRATALYWGRFADYRAVEPLEILRETTTP